MVNPVLATTIYFNPIFPTTTFDTPGHSRSSSTTSHTSSCRRTRPRTHATPSRTSTWSSRKRGRSSSSSSGVFDLFAGRASDSGIGFVGKFVAGIVGYSGGSAPGGNTRPGRSWPWTTAVRTIAAIVDLRPKGRNEQTDESNRVMAGSTDAAWGIDGTPRLSATDPMHAIVPVRCRNALRSLSFLHDPLPRRFVLYRVAKPRWWKGW